MNKYNIIAYSLWGDDSKYLKGAFENLKLCKEFYPTWKVRIYIDDTIPMGVAKELHDSGAQINLVKDHRGEFYGMYWRFWVNDDPEVDKFLVRDCDSRISIREKKAVDEWIESGKSFHVMRDHPHHNFEIQGGMWGGTAGVIPNITQLILNFNRYGQYGCDQFFLKQVIWPIICNDCMVHDEVHHINPFPCRNADNTHVGQIYDENNIPVWR